MPDLRKLVARLDWAQQRHQGSAFVAAVVKKYGDDQGGSLAALVTYYGFLSLFPLLLAAVTILGFLLPGNPGLRDGLVDSALANFPIIGPQIGGNVSSLHGSGFALAVGLVGAIYGGLGVANATQTAMNRIWAVPLTARPGYVARTLRSAKLIATVGVSIVASTVLGGVVSHASWLGVAGKVVGIVVAVLFDIALMWVLFRVTTVSAVGWRAHLPGAVVAGVARRALEVFGGLYITRILGGMDQTYGLFAIVIGLLSWISLEAQIVLIAAEINVVRHRKMWPRSFVTEPAITIDPR